MSKIRIAIVSFFTLLTLLVPSWSVSAQERVELNFFYSLTCPHCTKEKAFLIDLEQKYPELEINRFDVAKQESIDSLSDFYKQYNVPEEKRGMVPANFMEDKYFIGFNDAIAGEMDDYIGQLLSGSPGEIQDPASGDSKKISLPFVGQIDVSRMSPLALSIVLGTLDGFNACALMALGILLAFLVSTGMRQKVILVGGTFIVVSAVVYFLFISAWFNLFMALGSIKWITIIIGVITLLFGAYVLRDYFNDLICKLCDINGKETLLGKWQKKMFTRIANITMKQMSLPLLLIAVAIVSAGISAIELVCSFGFPLAFTKILISQNLSVPTYYFYLVVYIIFYCLLEFLIFLIAVVTMRVTRIGDKYLQVAKLLSGIVLLVLALIILFKPGLLMF